MIKIETESYFSLAICIFLIHISLFSKSISATTLFFPELEGFPFLIPDEKAGRSSVNVGDIEGDGDLEICFGTSDDKIYMLHHTGSVVEGWPIVVEKDVRSTPSLVDLDNDGDLEIVVTNSAYIYAWHHDGTPVDGWPVLLTNSVDSDATPAIGDIDGDGDFEIVHGADEYPCYMFAWHHDGTPVDGWPVTLPPGYYNHCEAHQPAALADLDEDGTLEVIVLTRGGKVFVFNHDGTDFQGWPKEDLEPMTYCAPAVGDIDGDGEVDIVAGTDWYTVYAWDRFGNDKPGWPWENEYEGGCVGVVLADLVGNSAKEVIVNYVWPDSVNIFVIDGSTGMELPGWPQPEGSLARSIQSVVISDIDYDGEREVVMAGYDDCYNFICRGYILAYNTDGTLVPGFPISLGYEASAYAPCIIDLDQDGDLEICAVTGFGYIFFGDCYLHVWDLPDPFVKDQEDWRFLLHDPFHTNNNGFLLPTENPIDVDLSPDTVTVNRGDSFDLTATFANRNVVFQTFNTALFLRMPNGEPYANNPLFGPFSFHQELLSDFSITRSLYVPLNTPLGGYRFLLPAGTSIHNIMDMDSSIVNVIE